MAKNKTYVYSINMGEVNALENTIVYQYNRPINIQKIKKVSKLFCGEHNFLSFSTDSRTGESLIKKVRRINFKVKDGILYISVTGNGFLRSQVRMIVGSLLAYEQNKLTIDQIKDLFYNPQKGKSTYRAPACGLCLYKVRY